jgi:hypothetical protein
MAAPTGLGHGVYKDNIDYNVFSGEWLIGRIYERNGFPDEVRFFWSLHGVVLTRPPSIHTDGHAQHQFRTSCTATPHHDDFNRLHYFQR